LNVNKNLILKKYSTINDINNALKIHFIHNNIKYACHDIILVKNVKVEININVHNVIIQIRINLHFKICLKKNPDIVKKEKFKLD